MLSPVKLISPLREYSPAGFIVGLLPLDSAYTSPPLTVIPFVAEIAGPSDVTDFTYPPVISTL